MLNFCGLIETALEQGRRILLQTIRSKYLVSLQKNFCLQTEVTQPGLTQKSAKKHSTGNSSRSYGPLVVAECMPSGGLPPTTAPGGRLLSRLGPVTSRFVQGLVRKVSSPLWAEARRRANKSIVFGQSAPFFALVGVSLVSGPERGLITKDDELEALCENIREAVSRAGWIHNPKFWTTADPCVKEGNVDTTRGLCFDDIEIGSVVGKGANAVVYAARWKEPDPLCVAKEESLVASAVAEHHLQPVGELEQSEVLRQFLGQRDVGQSPPSKSSNLEVIHSLSSLNPLHLSHFAVTDLTYPSCSVSYSGEAGASLAEQPSHSSPSHKRRKRVKFKSVCEVCEDEDMVMPDIASAENGRRVFGEQEHQEEVNKAPESSQQEFPLAVKMIFNYEAQSNAYAILTAMYKEIVPAQALPLTDSYQGWLQGRFGNRKKLPAHPNIVDMPCAFVDRVPNTKEGMMLFPDALPTRLNPAGFGRNMTLFCVMKRYDCCLAAYLSKYEPSTRTSMFLFVQLLEAMHHLHSHGIAHRDLKRDNILLNLDEGWEYPALVVSDFGCCLADPSGHLNVAFSSWEADPREGNPALAAPEVKLAVPGMLSSVSYASADIWTCGALAYELFGQDNPFDPFMSLEITSLDSAHYRESQLLRIPKRVPAPVRHLVLDLLKRNPRQRPSPVIAATICQLVLWAPTKWLQRHSLMLPSHNEVTQWLLCLSTKTLCEAGYSSPHRGDMVAGQPRSHGTAVNTHGQLEYEIVSTFLNRVHYIDIIKAVKWTKTF